MGDKQNPQDMNAYGQAKSPVPSEGIAPQGHTTGSGNTTQESTPNSLDGDTCEVESPATSSESEFGEQKPADPLLSPTRKGLRRTLPDRLGRRSESAIEKARELLGSDQATATAKVVGGLAAAVILGEIKRRTSNSSAPPPTFETNQNSTPRTIGAKIGGLAAAALAHELERRIPKDPIHNSQPTLKKNSFTAESATMEPSWSPPSWANISSPETADYYIGVPVRFRLGPSELARLERHPELPGLYVEVTMTGFRSYALAIDWHTRVPRIFYTAQEIPESWTPVQHDEYVLPMELRRDEELGVWCRWLRSSSNDRDYERANTSEPAGQERSERRIQKALDMLGRQQPHWHV